MTNHSSCRAFRFSWNPAGQRVCFLPQVASPVSSRPCDVCVCVRLVHEGRVLLQSAGMKSGFWWSERSRLQ